MTGLLYDVQRQPLNRGPRKPVTMLANGWQCFLLKMQMVNVRDQHRVSSTSMLLGPSKGNPVHVASLCKLNHVLLDPQVLYDGNCRAYGLPIATSCICNVMSNPAFLVSFNLFYQITHAFLQPSQSSADQYAGMPTSHK